MVCENQLPLYDCTLLKLGGQQEILTTNLSMQMISFISIQDNLQGNFPPRLHRINFRTFCLSLAMLQKYDKLEETIGHNIYSQ